MHRTGTDRRRRESDTPLCLVCYQRGCTKPHLDWQYATFCHACGRWSRTPLADRDESSKLRMIGEGSPFRTLIPGVDEPECNHIWVHYEAGEDASATLNAPEGYARWSEPVFVCVACDAIQPEAVIEARAGGPSEGQGG